MSATFRHIVVGCDDRSEARDAVTLGAMLSAATGAGLSLVAAYRQDLFPTVGLSDRRTLRRQAMAALRRARDEIDVAVVLDAVADNSVPRALTHYAARWKAGVVVLGSSSQAKPGHAAISRRGRQFVYDAPFALAIAAQGLHTRPAALRTIAVGWDGGPEANAALETAASLGRGAGAQLHVITVVDDALWMPGVDRGPLAAEWAEVLEDERTAARVRAEDAVGELGAGAHVTATIGEPGAELRRLSDGCDLVVVGSRRWGTVARLVMGGVGETLVADSRCSVMIVPRPRVRRKPRARAGAAQTVA